MCRCWEQLFFRDAENEAYFGLFDGHGGRNASDFAAKFLHELLSQGLDSGEYEDETDRLLVDCFLEINDLMGQQAISDGTTALVSYMCGRRVWVANAGDSRAVLCRFVSDFLCSPPV